jgi:signal peptidase I
MEKVKKPNSLRKEIILLVIAIILALLFRSIVFEPYVIPSGSMKPNLLVGDYVFISKYEYGISRYSFPFGPDIFEGRILFDNKPKRGDVIVFKPPHDMSISYIKRLIGLPNDKVQMRNGMLYVNGKKLLRKSDGEFKDEVINRVTRDVAYNNIPQYIETNQDGESYTILKASSNAELDETEEFIVPEKMYFFMGDNRDNSLDSRSKLGFVPEENIVGKAKMIFFSSRSSFFEIWRWISDIRIERIFKKID